MRQNSYPPRGHPRRRKAISPLWHIFLSEKENKCRVGTQRVKDKNAGEEAGTGEASKSPRVQKGTVLGARAP